MKALMIAASAAAVLAAVPAVASAQDFSPTTIDASIGYAGSHVEGVDLGGIQGRLGARFGRFVGVQGEAAFGVRGDTVDVMGTPVDVKLRHQEAIYGVGYIPVTPDFDIFGRVGYGNTSIRADAGGVGAATESGQSWNYGAGGQFFMGANGVRADFTRYDFNNGGNADVWAVAYVRKF